MSGTGTPPTLTAFTAGDLVVSVVGDVNNNGTYTLDQASPIYLQELTTSGSVVGQLVLPQTTTIVNGTTEYAISGEYGSASEGSLQLSGDGQSLVILGYGVDANAFNTGTIYGTSALGQTTSIPGGTVTAVPRIVADINFNAKIDTSTELFNVFNTNNPRAVATVNGTTFYLSGQGVKGDTAQGVFVAHDGATSATAIDTSTDTRFISIYNGELYVSRDSTESSTAGTNIANYGTALPTSETTPSVLPGISESITLTAAQENAVNASAVGTTVNLSPENFFFASPTVLYVADSGDPKNGGIGDGGLQKWVLNSGTWTLEYTLSQGLNLVNSTTATSGTCGLIGLTGTVVGGVVEIYATTETVGETDQSYLYGITDTLSATSGTGESFTLLDTAAPDTIIRGVSFAPTEAVTTPSTTSVTSGTTSSGFVVTSGSTLDVLSGGTVVSAAILSGGSAVISGGGIDSATDIAQGGHETVLGSATGDFIGGVQLVSAASAVVTNEIVLNGGSLELFLKGAIANSTSVGGGGGLLISGNAVASNTVINGGSVVLESGKATLEGALTFSGPGLLEFASIVTDTSSSGEFAVISDFGSGDTIDITSATSIGSVATLSTSTSGGNTVAVVSGGTISQSLTFAGTFIATELQLTSDGNGGQELAFSAPSPTSTTVGSGVSSGGIVVTSGSFLDVLSGGTVVSTTILSAGSAQIEIGGVDSGATVFQGGNEMVFGSATGDAISGTQILSAPTSAASSIAVVSNETVFNGGAVDLFLKGAVANNVTVMSGGDLTISGNAVASNTVLSGGTVVLESGKATLSGGLTFATAGMLDITTFVSATLSSGDDAVISNFSSGDVVDYTFIGAGASFGTTTSGGNTVATVTSNGQIQTAIFAGTTIASNLTLVSDNAGGQEIAFTTSASSSSTSGTSVTSGETSSGLVVSGGTSLDVQSGGTIVSASILSTGSATIQVGAVDSASTVSGGGSETVLGSATLDQIGGTQFIDGTAVSETILSNGSAIVEATGTDSGSVILAGGNETVLNFANQDLVYGTQLVSAATAVVSNETVFNGGNVELFLAGAIGSGVTVETGGAITISGRGTAEATVLSGGSIVLESPKATISGTLTFDGAASLIESVTISPVSAGILFGDQAVNIGFGAGDEIAFTSATSVGAAGSAATLTISTSGGNTVATVSGNGSTEPFVFAGTTIGASLSLVTNGGLLELVTCFVAGTRIATPRGEVPVERLAVGDRVMMAGPGRRSQPIIWIGHRSIDLTRHPAPKKVLPIHIARGAFGRGLPRRPLLLSPDHSVFAEGVLIPIRCLINGSTIVQQSPTAASEVMYYHLELRRHDVVLAEGLAVESYLDTGNRSCFSNGGAAVELHPDFNIRVWEAEGYAPLCVTGAEIERLRARLGRVAARLRVEAGVPTTRRSAAA